MKVQDKELNKEETQAVAIIGVSLRFPQSDSLEEFWDHLKNEESLITEVSPERWDKKEYFGNPRRDGNKTNSIWGGFIENADCFDADFFNISPREAESMDPQQRMALELAWKAIEDAGYRPSALSGTSTGVFMGVCHWDYAELLERDVEDIDAYIPTGIAYSIIANRISYFYDLRGPSITNDTACASSLVSIYEAVRSINDGECEYALAGGVNLCWSPNHFIAFSKNGMLSKDGKCQAFDNSANGYVRGEGGAMLLLKPLDKAKEDNDPIYAVIKGIGTNHGGKTSSLTVTNPQAQAELIADIYTKAGVSPDTVSYIEAHGPGTPIGDPIEVLGLKNAFNQLYEKDDSANKTVMCGLGSVKTNIGHTEGAAGVAGVVKVLAAMKNKTLPGTVNFKELNSIINLKESPFYIVDKTQPWNSAILDSETTVRRAGVSSFGFGGSNAHILLEEYNDEDSTNDIGREIEEKILQAIPLSAKNEERLKENAERLLIFLKASQDTEAKELSLRDIAYTLQLGREAMDERVVFLANSVEELVFKLSSYIGDSKSIELSWQGNAKNSIEKASLLSDDDFDDLVDKWLVKGQLKKVAELWVTGVTINWGKLYGDTELQKLRLPTYSFSKDRHWYQTTKKKKSTGEEGIKKLHPLVNSNTSTLEIQRFSSVFDGSEFFLADHIIKGNVILPGVAYMEMARVAAAMALDDPIDDINIQLQNVVWIKPVVIGSEPENIHISIHLQEDQLISFDIYSEKDQDTTSYCKGYLKRAVGQSDQLNLSSLRNTSDMVSYSARDCYNIIRKTDQVHGKSLQGLKELYLTEREVLAKIELPDSVADTANRFVLHPSIMDTVMQASIILLLGKNQIQEDKEKMDAALPFAIQSLEILSRCKSNMWAWISYAKGSQSTDDLRKLDMYLSDDEGHVCVRIKGYSARVFTGKVNIPEANQFERIEEVKEEEAIGQNIKPIAGELVYTTNFWKERKLNLSESSIGTRTTSIVLFGFETELVDYLRSNIDLSVETLADASSTLDDQQISHSFQKAFQYVQNILQSRPKEKQQLLMVLPETEGNYLYASLVALLKTAKLENPKIEGKVIWVTRDMLIEPKALLNTLANEVKSDGDEIEIRYTNINRREARYLSVFDLEHEFTKKPMIKSGGVYWITGGLGGLGKMLTEHIANINNVTLVLNGRSALDHDKEQILSGFREKGATVEYVQGDLADKESVQKVVNHILDRYKNLDGIFHCAGVVKDAYILTKPIDEIKDVFEPKVNGLFHLDETTKELELDFIALFSSIAAHGNIGQADYAGANAVLDAFATHRNRQVSEGKRKGKTVAANWPLWASGGMRVDQATLQHMLKNKGMLPLPSEEGIQALEHMLSTDQYGNIGVVYGEKDKIIETIGMLKRDTTLSEKQEEMSEKSTGEVSIKDLKQGTSKLLKEIIGKSIRVDPSKIQVDQKLSEYGLDSIVIIDVTGQLEDIFGSLSKTLFFEYVDIQGIVEYFIEEHKEKLIEVLEIAKPQSVVSAAPKVKQEILRENIPTSRFSIPHTSGTEKVKSTSTVEKEVANDPSSYHDIAIVGVGGKYPEADTLEDFWDNLSAGKDCFRKVPSERWEHDEIYFNERDILGKSTIKTGAFIDDIDKFDPRYFSISQQQAELMSPEVRLFLEVGVDALEDAGYSKEYLQKKYAGDVGVLVGTMSNHYYLYGVQNMLTRGSLANGSYTGTIPNMLSYYYGFTGPSIFLDTMCSGSSTCIHQAVQMLRTKECKMVVVGGISLLLHPYHFISSSQEHYTTKTAEIIRSYGLGADGTILGEGVGAMVLKPLVEAEKDGDHIYGVIKGTALSNAGIRNGFTVPNPHNQGLAIEKAIKDAKIDPRTISYVEGHGSGTALGDPIEIKGISTVFKKYTDDLQFCPIGSVKSNIAHLLGAAGIAGLTKVLLQFKHEKLVPSLHADEINPSINFEKTPFYVHKKLSDWKQPVLNIEGRQQTIPRRAGITSIGAGGMNSHIIVEEYKEKEADNRALIDQPQLLVFSAMNNKILETYLKEFREYATDLSDIDLQSVAYTLQVGKNELPCRLAIQVDNVTALKESIDFYLSTVDNPHLLRNNQDIQYISSILERESDLDADEVDQLMADRNLSMLSKYWVNGISIDWDQFHASYQPKRVSLPSYPFEKIRCWYEVYDDAPSVQNPMVSRTKHHPFIGENISDLKGVKYATDIQLDEILDYVYTVQGKQQVLPSFVIDTAFALGYLSGIKNQFKVKQFHWTRSIDWATVEGLRILVSTEQEGHYKLSFVLKDANQVESNFCEVTIAEDPQLYESRSEHLNIQELIETSNGQINETPFYDTLVEGEISYAPYLEGVSMAYASNSTLLLKIGESSLKQDHYKKQVTLTPEVLGALLQGVQYWSKKQNMKGWRGLIPQLFGEVQLVSSTPKVGYILFELKMSHQQVSGEIRFADKYGKVIGTIQNAIFTLTSGFTGRDSSYHSTSKREVISLQEEISVDNQGVKVQLAYFLRKEVSSILKFNLEEIDNHTHFYAYGFESIALAKLSDNINKQLKTEINPAIFFQCENILELTDYILSNEEDKCEIFFQTKTKQEPGGHHTSIDASSENQLIESKLVYALRKYVSRIVKFKIEEIDSYTHFYSYGFESIALEKLAREINKDLKTDLTPAIFFQCENIHELAAYMMSHNSDQLKTIWSNGVIADHTTSSHKAAHQASTGDSKDSADRQKPIESYQKVNTHGQRRIAIIGASGKFPQSDDLEEFWKKIDQGSNLIADFPLERYDEYYQKKINAADFPKRAGTINDVDRFDADFFNISPVEAELMDPQHRLVLETVWKAMEDSGYIPDHLPDSTGVFFGVTGKDYANLLTAYDIPVDAFTATGTAHSMLANRVSFTLDIHGPSEPVDTACSSSLVSIHRAIESIVSGTCDMAIAGGVNLVLSTDEFVGPYLGGMLSEDGACKTFSKNANGYVRGEGVGAVILKPLEQAERDGDNILGVIIGSATNHGGRASSLTAPNAKSQASLIEKAMKGIDHQTISYIEAHGTGTSLGDPVEINGLKLAFQNMEAHATNKSKQAYCGLGSVKTNIGHLEAAAGVASLLKVLAAMKHRTLPASLHSQDINPFIDLKNSPFYIVNDRKVWDAQQDEKGDFIPRRAGISSFGFGGANAHLVVEEYIQTTPNKPVANTSQLIILSAKNTTQLRNSIENLCAYLGNSGHDLNFRNIAYTLQVGREAMGERLAVIADSLPSLLNKLKAFLNGDSNGFFTGSVKRNQASLATFTTDDTQIKVLKEEFDNQDYDQVAELWVKGLAIEWKQFYVDDQLYKISLPTYPFAKQRYWISGLYCPETPVGSPEITDSQTVEEYQNTDSFYTKLIEGLSNDNLSVDDAMEIAKSI